MNRKTLATAALLVAVLAPCLPPPAAQAQDMNDIRRKIEDFLRPNPNPGTPNPGGNNSPPSSNPNRVNNGGTLTNANGQITRSMHLARQAAERTNGGLNVYRAEPAMYTVEQARYVVNRDNSVTFTFMGGAPAEPPTIQSVVTVDPNKSTVNVDYNGPVRTGNPNSDGKPNSDRPNPDRPNSDRPN
jgi:hypothetical protein